MIVFSDNILWLTHDNAKKYTITCICVVFGAEINNLLSYASVMPLVMAFAFSQTIDKRSEETNENISVTSSAVS